MELRGIETRLQDIKALTRRVSFTSDDTTLYDLPTSWFDAWTEGEKYEVGRVVVKADVKYLVLEPVMASKYLDPSTVTARNSYEPIQGSQNVYRWVYGERVYLGYAREYEGVVYVAQTDIAKEKNITTPDLNSADWKPVEDEVI